MQLSNTISGLSVADTRDIDLGEGTESVHAVAAPAHELG